MKINKITVLITLKKILYILLSTIIISTLNIISSNITTTSAKIIISLPFAAIISLIIFKIKDRKLDLLQKLLCLFFATMIIIGKSFNVFGSLLLIKKFFIFSLISIYFIYFLFTKLFMFLDYLLLEKKYKEIKSYFFLNILTKNPFTISLIFIIGLWLIYIISWYPGIFSADPINELKAYFNISSEITEKANLINPNVHWTTQHSILHTYNLGIAVDFANFIGNNNLGFFLIYTLPQIALMSILLAYTIKFMNNQKVAPQIMFIILLFYILAPLYPHYSLTINKMVYYTLFLMIYILLIFDLLKNYNNQKYPIKKLILLILTSLLVVLFRNEGRYIILISLISTLFIKHINKTKILIVISLILTFLFAYENIFIKKMEITPQNNAAYFSIPFQQIARYTYFYEDELSEKDKEIIDNIIVYDTLAERYNPYFSDPVNLEFNTKSTNEDIKAFLNVWFKHLLKHPICYIEAFLHQNHTFYYPTALDWYIYIDEYHLEDLEEIIDINYQEHLAEQRLTGSALGYAEYLYFPGIRYLLYNGTHFWILLIASYYILKNNAKYIITLIPLYLVFLVCLVGPSNWYRYSLPITFSIPIIIGITSYTLKNKNIKENTPKI